MQEWWIYCIIFRRTVWETDSLFTLQISRELDSVSETAQWVHAVQHIWIQFSQGQNSSHTHSPGRRLLRTRFITATPGTHTHMQEITRVINILTTFSIKPINGWRGKHLLTDTRHVSGWPLAVRGETDVLYAWWLQSCLFNVQMAALCSEQGHSD